jgi:hypothetical protein
MVLKGIAVMISRFDLKDISNVSLSLSLSPSLSLPPSPSLSQSLDPFASVFSHSLISLIIFAEHCSS